MIPEDPLLVDARKNQTIALRLQIMEMVLRHQGGTVRVQTDSPLHPVAMAKQIEAYITGEKT